MRRNQSRSRRAVLCGIGSASLGTVVPTAAASARRGAQSETDLAAAIETGVVEGGKLVQEQAVRITQEQVQAAADGIAAAVSQSQDVSVHQVQAVATGATQGALLQNQYVNVDQIQAAAGGAADGACTAQEQDITVEQYQFATAYGAADAIAVHDDKHADTIYDAAKDYVTEEIDYFEKHGDSIETKTRKSKVKVEERKQVKFEDRPKGRKERKKKAPKKKKGKKRKKPEKRNEKRKGKQPKKSKKEPKKRKRKKSKKESKVEQSQSVDVSQNQRVTGGKGGSVEQSQSVSVDQRQSSSGGGSTHQSQSVDVSQSQSFSSDDE